MVTRLLANGTYTISHSHPYGKICIIVYGFYQHGGYGYLSGMLLDPTNEPSHIPSITVPVDNSNTIIICLVAVVLILVCIIIGIFLFYLHERRTRFINAVVDTSLSIGNPVAVHTDIIDGHSNGLQPTNQVSDGHHYDVIPPIDPDGFISQSIPQPFPVNPTHLMLGLQQISDPDGSTQSSTIM